MSESTRVVEPSPRIVLGSASPRRSQLLGLLGLRFEVATASIDEAGLVDRDDGTGVASVARIAAAKFAAIRAAASVTSGSVGQRSLLTADTLVACAGVVMGKPSSPTDTVEMLRDMSGRELVISTGLCFGPIGATPESLVVTTSVVLRNLDSGEIANYAQSGVGQDKAGGLALQAEANGFITSVDGCWSNVLGLPLCAVAELMDLAPLGTPRLGRCSPNLCGSPDTTLVSSV